MLCLLILWGWWFITVLMDGRRFLDMVFNTTLLREIDGRFIGEDSGRRGKGDRGMEVGNGV